MLIEFEFNSEDFKNDFIEEHFIYHFDDYKTKQAHSCILKLEIEDLKYIKLTPRVNNARAIIDKYGPIVGSHYV